MSASDLVVEFHRAVRGWAHHDLRPGEAGWLVIERNERMDQRRAGPFATEHEAVDVLRAISRGGSR